MSGTGLWECLRTLDFDWDLLSRTRGCYWGAFLGYIGCRYGTVVAVTSSSIYICAIWFHHYKSLSYMWQVASTLSIGFAYQIMSIRVITIWRKRHIFWATVLLQLGVWICAVIGIWFTVHTGPSQVYFEQFFSVYLFTISNFILVMVAYGLVRARQRRLYPFNNRKLHACAWNDLYDESLSSLLVFWTGRFVASTVSLMDLDEVGYVRLMTGYTGYILVVTCACRTYVTMVDRSRSCPVDVPYNIREFLRYGPGRIQDAHREDHNNRIVTPPNAADVVSKAHQTFELNVIADHSSHSTIRPTTSSACPI